MFCLFNEGDVYALGGGFAIENTIRNHWLYSVYEADIYLFQHKYRAIVRGYKNKGYEIVKLLDDKKRDDFYVRFIDELKMEKMLLSYFFKFMLNLSASFLQLFIAILFVSNVFCKQGLELVYDAVIFLLVETLCILLKRQLRKYMLRRWIF